MKVRKQRDYLHLAIIGAVLISFGASFDAWWHVSIGRDSFFVLPHLFFYGGVATFLISSYWGWRKQGHMAWKNIFLVLLLIPLALPLDQIWHHFRGRETVDSVLIIWSPPHLLLFVSTIAALFLMTRMLHRKENMAVKELFGALLLASLLDLLFIVLGPFFPFSPFVVAGLYWGAAITAFTTSWIFFYARRLLPHVAPAFLVAAFAIMLQSIISDSAVVYGSRAFGSYPYLPSWILILSQITMAIVVDMEFIKNYAVRGLLAGIVSGVIIYVVSLYFIDPLYQFSLAAASLAVLCAGIGSAAGGLLQRKK